MVNKLSFDNSKASKLRCLNYRLRLLEISQKVSALHLAGSFSCLEILDAIYFNAMRPNDIFILSKGHAGIAQYVILEERGILTRDKLDNYASHNSELGVHPTRDIPGIYMGTGSLGHGLNIAIGSAIIRKKSNAKVYVVISDGELQEGSVWEGILNAPALLLDNLTVVIDFNDFQSLGKTSETHPNLFPLREKFESFGWQVFETDGHSYTEMSKALSEISSLPKIIIAKTTKGKGVSYMENEPIWHYRSPSEQEYELAKSELESKFNEK